MHLYKTMRDFLIDNDYYIDIYEKNIHVYNYIDILKLNDQEISLKISDFILNILGNNFTVKRLEKKEILITGSITKMEFLR